MPMPLVFLAYATEKAAESIFWYCVASGIGGGAVGYTGYYLLNAPDNRSIKLQKDMNELQKKYDEKRQAQIDSAQQLISYASDEMNTITTHLHTQQECLNVIINAFSGQVANSLLANTKLDELLEPLKKSRAALEQHMQTTINEFQRRQLELSAVNSALTLTQESLSQKDSQLAETLVNLTQIQEQLSKSTIQIEEHVVYTQRQQQIIDKMQNNANKTAEIEQLNTELSQLSNINSEIITKSSGVIETLHLENKALRDENIELTQTIIKLTEKLEGFDDDKKLSAQEFTTRSPLMFSSR